ncbi:acetoacetate--CoA ligase [Actinomadura craniellae]|uniref:Acetoacetate--CoA ligase n=1 Tax=Actinomadura craniellae TaxID=2231787 RepID=A0A365H5M6_9ACTN|nr:acetoacetate--CoA ligase [Actinomadura craniellae]RAY14306.1 acetoacetate--CoA ligase [Actinomadura craniellae]
MIKEGTLLWEPSAEVVERAQLTRYLRWLAERGVEAGTYDELWRWSVTETDAFWDSLWPFFDVRGERGTGPVRTGTEMPGVRWFPGATLNYAGNALRPEHADRLAVIGRAESGAERRLTYGELAAEVRRVRRALHRQGVRRGDRVAAYLPNTPDALVFLLATASLGAIWSCCSPDFGAPSVIDRFSQIEPVVLVAVESYVYNGRVFSRAAELGDIVAALPSLRATVVVAGDPKAVPGGLGYEEFLATEGDDPDPEFAAVPFDHPLWIVYSSGTTGLPKPIVHSHGGIVLEHLKALSFHQDIGPGDVFFWFTTTGWMMWNYLVGGLLLGATVVLYDGAPTGDTVWRVAAETGTTYLGVGVPYILASGKAGLTPGADHDLSRLRGVGATGSPLPPEGFAWVYEAVGADLLLGSLSGGTDVCTGFVGPSVLLPLRAGVIQCAGLGAAVAAFDEEGRPLVGEVGELVLTRPMPSMPVFFWNDPGDERYQDSYFSVYPGIWRHGDWIKVLPDGGCVIYGRSDSTLNRGGVRMGTADFYRVVEAFDEILDSLVIDTGRLGSEGRLLLYVQLAPGAELDDDLLGRLRSALRSSLSPRHVPDEIVGVPGVPRTLSGKKLEIPVRKILLGTPVAEAANPDSLANPEVLSAYRPLE